MSGNGERLQKTLLARATIIQEIRAFFLKQDYLEVDTPILHQAPIPEANIELFSSGRYYLQASPEYLMKRLAARGMLPIFQLARCFRKNEIGTRHMQEFLLLEWYRPGTYLDLMVDCESLFLHLLQNTANCINTCATARTATPCFLRQNFTCATPWPRLTVAEAFQLYGKISPEEALHQNLFEEILTRDIEPHLGTNSPLFLLDYPASCGSLARKKPDDPTLTERFELYIQGIEIANGFSELSDPAEQQARFKTEHDLIYDRGRTPPPMPDEFLHDIATLPPTAGIALGIDRLVMLLTGRKQISDVVFNPPELRSCP